MDVAVGLPATIPGTPGERVLDWAAHADDGPFSSLAVIDRVGYANYEPLVALAAAAAVTGRVRLMTTVLVAPLRNPGMLAKQAASVDAVSGGRLTLGLGIGGRDEDYAAAGSPVDFSRRARALEEQLRVMRRIWAGDPAGEDLPPIGPRPRRVGGPEVLLGGYSAAAAQRAGRLGDGFIAGRLPVSEARGLYDVAAESWREAGRPGRPRFAACAYFCLGDADVVERGRGYVLDYYAFAGPGAEKVAEAILASPEQVRERLEAAEAAGVDEYVLWPTVADLDQVQRLAEAVP